jgi:hypothetical protein
MRTYWSKLGHQVHVAGFGFQNQRRRAADHRMVADAHMAAHDRIVGNDHMIAELAVMRDMHHRHQQTVRADTRGAKAGDGAAMDRAMLADLRARADLAARRLALVFEVLRRQTHRAEREQHRVRPDARVAVHHDMRDEFGAILDHRIGSDRAERADADVRADLRLVRHDRGRVDVHPPTDRGDGGEGRATD